MAGAPKNNTNAEKWNLEDATNFMNEAVKLSKSTKYDFVGEVAKDLGQYHQLFTYLKDKFPELEYQYKMVFANCETNCFLNGKKGDIIPSLAIMNLKSNHKWTDRTDVTTKGNEVINTVDYSKLSNEALKEIANATSLFFEIRPYCS